ncbi:chemotaxis protein CheA [Bradyrhizobium sp. AUGA SZCCT0283]|uniref:chemotaxis protein CheA n=1 Tax=Bradyrhizobium sp. AUGA SZCCT0283 TaxID=2807671 RepID=UPI001BAD1017|nr:chemotaxis protein CheA [Bradyrhizobium sp. AUGA SZCCT0283]MBR1279986.1 chemotaxis protein CheA [Bradyrhizobium sp. AUGA SZCCT0283]
MSALEDQFVAEARELIRQATDNLIALERDGMSPERIDSVFRAFHTLKGSAGVVELPAMSIVLHAAEDLLDSVRHGTLGAGAEIVDAALTCLDQVSHWVDTFEAAGALPSRAGEDSRVMAQRLRSFLPRRGDEQPAASVPDLPNDAGQGLLPEWVSQLIAAERDAITSRMPEGPMTATAISYEPFAGCFYNGDDPVHLMQQVPGLLAFQIEPREPFVPLADIDPYACNLRLRAISIGNRDEIAALFRLVPDQTQIISVPPEAFPAAEVHVGSGNKSLICKVIEAQCELLRVPDRADELAGCIGAVARVAENALRHGERLDLADTVGRAGALALAQQDAGPLLSALERALAAFASPPSTAVNGVSQAASERPADRVLRVGEAKIEALVNLAGELVVARNALSYSLRQVERKLDGSEVARSIQRDRDAIDRLVTELHGSVLQLRMVPVAQLFGSFPRLVRDVARQLDKKVALATSGEATEVDKTIMDRLFEPMVHLVRNALDHGVENPGQRRAAGKSEAAKISIAASRSGDRLLVEVADDGRGIDPAVVRRKAFERQILPPDELAGLTDEAAVDLVFSAGFSTASIVSDISGRGFGMDVVRTAIEQIGGRVSLESKVGAGTTVRLDLPMTIAMSRIMVVEAGGQSFGIAMEAVSETVRVPPDRVSTIKNNDGFVLRDRVVPIISLAELMKLPGRKRDAAEPRLLVVTEAAGKIAAFEIDAVRDRLDVVLKPMQGLLSGARGYAGTTLLGNGQVLLVLDMKEILP